MERQNLEAVHRQVRLELERCVDFWLRGGIDPVHGGVYTCLDEQGGVYSTDKSVWMQGRCAWTFSHLCNVYGSRPEWQNAAESCLDFLERHCINREAGNRMYFTVTAEGKPLRQRRYCFSEGFYAIANAEYYALTGDTAYRDRARDAYELIWKLNSGELRDPAGFGPKTIPATRDTRGLADPMIYLNISTVLRRCDPEREELYAQRADACCEQILQYHHKPELRATLECVGRQGQFLGDVTAGRVVNPGHSIECAWFLLEHARYRQDRVLLDKAAEMFRFSHDLGWDTQYGGLLYYTDVLGKPTEAYEHDMKLWWPHNELLIAALMLYRETGEAEYWRIFSETWEYCLRVFSDPEHGEWYGYLRRDGVPTQPPTKGSTFKGPFHLPRMLILADGLLGELMENN